MFLKQIPMAQLTIGVSVVVAVAFMLLDGTFAVVIAIVGGGLIAMKAAGGDDRRG